MIVTVEVRFFTLPPPEQPAADTRVSSTRASAGIQVRLVRFATIVKNASSTVANANNSGGVRRKRLDGKLLGSLVQGSDREDLGVEMFTTNDKAELPVTLTAGGDTSQVAEDGAPLQLNVTVPLNPPIAMTCKL